jgi:hypothetical protein
LNFGYLQFLEDALKVSGRSAGTQTWIYWEITEKPPKEFLASLGGFT